MPDEKHYLDVIAAVAATAVTGGASRSAGGGGADIRERNSWCLLYRSATAKVM